MVTQVQTQQRSFGSNALTDEIAVFTLELVVVEQNVATPVISRPVFTKIGPNVASIQHQFFERLVAQHSDEFFKIRAEWMCQGLVNLGVSGCCVEVGVGIRPSQVVLQLQIQVVYAQRVDVFQASLQRKFVGPIPLIIRNEPFEQKFIDGQLAVELDFAKQVPLAIKTQDHVVWTSQTLLYCPVKNDRIEVVEFKVIRAGEHHGFKKPQVEVWPQVDAQVVSSHVFFLLDDIVAVKIGRGGHHLGKNVLEMKLPNVPIELEVNVIGCKIGKK